MNAYELADWLDRRREAYEPNGWASDMLRQQADRIADLETANEFIRQNDGFLRKEFQLQGSRIKNLMEHIEMLEKAIKEWKKHD